MMGKCKKNTDNYRITITFDDLQGYIKYTKNVYPDKISLNDYIKYCYNIPEKKIYSDLSNIVFDINHQIDLSGSDLSFTCLDNINFDGNFVLLKNANLNGASTKNCKFTNLIDLTGVNLGNIVLNKNIFVSCILEHSLFPSYSIDRQTHDSNEVLFIKPSNIELDDYCKLRRLFDSTAQGNLNQYLADKYLNKNDCNKIDIVADLSYLKFPIEGLSLDEADLSGSKIDGCVFSGNFNQVSFRNCTGKDVIFIDSILIDCDLRGVDLANIDSTRSKLVNPILSIGGNHREDYMKAQHVGIVPVGLRLSGQEVVYDPCYKRYDRESHLFKRSYYKINNSRQVVEEFIDLNKKHLISFKQFLNEKYHVPLDAIADLSGSNLDNMDISGLDFGMINLAFSSLIQTKADRVNLEGSNLDGVIFSGDWQAKIGNIFHSKSITSLEMSNLKGCKLNGIIAEGVNFFRANMDQVSAVRADFYKANLNECLLNKALLMKSCLSEVKACGIQAQYTDFSESEARKVIFCNGNFSYCNATKIDMYKAKLDGATINYTDLSYANLSWARLHKTEIISSLLTKVNLQCASFLETVLEQLEISEFKGMAILDSVNLDSILSPKVKANLNILKAKQKLLSKLENNSVMKQYINTLIKSLPEQIRGLCQNFINIIFSITNNKLLAIGSIALYSCVILAFLTATCYYALPANIVIKNLNLSVLPALMAGCFSGISTAYVVTEKKLYDFYRSVEYSKMDYRQEKTAYLKQKEIAKNIIKKSQELYKANNSNHGVSIGVDQLTSLMQKGRYKKTDSQGQGMRHT